MTFFESLRKCLAIYRQIRVFRKQDVAFRQLVFFSEGPEYWMFFSPIVNQLLSSGKVKVSFLASKIEDPGLNKVHENYRAFLIGEGVQRTFLFRTLSARLFILTMPNLNTLYLKRSVQDVKYIYLFHSMVSTHMVYPKGAFDHYDTIFCVGPQHVDEIRAAEHRYNLPPKELVNIGYPRLDQLLSEAKFVDPAGDTNVILVAPSWGEHCIFETIGEQLITKLLDGGYQVVLRPHPQTNRHRPDVIRRLKKWVEVDQRLSFDDGLGTHESLKEAGIMISDWSGAALEYAFAYERPVIFLDIPRKVRNPDYENIDIVPLEIKIRDQIGTMVHPDDIDEIIVVIKNTVKDYERVRRRIRRARDYYVFNRGHSIEKIESTLLSY